MGSSCPTAGSPLGRLLTNIVWKAMVGAGSPRGWLCSFSHPAPRDVVSQGSVFLLDLTLSMSLQRFLLSLSTLCSSILQLFKSFLEKLYLHSVQHLQFHKWTAQGVKLVFVYLLWTFQMSRSITKPFYFFIFILFFEGVALGLCCCQVFL